MPRGDGPIRPSFNGNMLMRRLRGHHCHHRAASMQMSQPSRWHPPIRTIRCQPSCNPCFNIHIKSICIIPCQKCKLTGQNWWPLMDSCQTNKQINKPIKSISSSFFPFFFEKERKRKREREKERKREGRNIDVIGNVASFIYCDQVTGDKS